jgi:hypothetical protein
VNRRFFPLALAAVWVVQDAAGQAPAPRVVALTAPDGTTLKPTYFAASKPGSGVMYCFTSATVNARCGRNSRHAWWRRG